MSFASRSFGGGTFAGDVPDTTNVNGGAALVVGSVLSAVGIGAATITIGSTTSATGVGSATITIGAAVTSPINGAATVLIGSTLSAPVAGSATIPIGSVLKADVTGVAGITTGSTATASGVGSATVTLGTLLGVAVTGTATVTIGGTVNAAGSGINGATIAIGSALVASGVGAASITIGSTLSADITGGATIPVGLALTASGAGQATITLGDLLAAAGTGSALAAIGVVLLGAGLAEFFGGVTITVGCEVTADGSSVTTPGATLHVGITVTTDDESADQTGRSTIVFGATVTAWGTTTPDAPADWTIEVWDPGANTLLRTLASPAFVAPAVDVLNSVGSFSFSLGLFDPDAPFCDPKLGREVKVHRAGVLRWAGRIWTDDVDFASHEATFGCLSLLDYFRDRYLDHGSARVNLLTNSDFELGWFGWTPVATTPSTVTTDHVLGTQCVELTQTVDDADAYLWQSFEYTGGGEGAVITLTGWVKILAWEAPALGNFGLVVRQTDGGFGVFDSQSADINYQTQQSQWVKLESTTQVPPLTTRTIEARLYSPSGVVEWDDVFASLYESFSMLGQDQASILVQTVRFAQNTDLGKDNLNIGTDAPATGVIRDRTYQFADHISVLQALTEYPTLVDGMDFELQPNRIMAAYALPAGIGADKTATAVLECGANCQPATRKFDGPSAASNVTTLGNGSGPGREEGGADDTSLYGGVIVQQVMPAPSPDTKIDILDSWAQRQLGVFRDPTSFEVIVTDRPLGYSLRIGDRVTLNADVGYVQESAHARIVQIAADPVTDFVTLSLNRVP